MVGDHGDAGEHLNFMWVTVCGGAVSRERTQCYNLVTMLHMTLDVSIYNLILASHQREPDRQIVTSKVKCKIGDNLTSIHDTRCTHEIHSRDLELLETSPTVLVPDSGCRCRK